jgi:hypothetical protein
LCEKLTTINLTQGSKICGLVVNQDNLEELRENLKLSPQVQINLLQPKPSIENSSGLINSDSTECSASKDLPSKTPEVTPQQETPNPTTTPNGEKNSLATAQRSQN